MPSEPLPDWKQDFSTPNVACATAALALLLSALFFERILSMAAIWRVDGNYSHGFLVIPISVALAYHNLKNLRGPLQAEIATGGAWMAAGLFVMLVTSIYRVMILDFFALALILRGAALTIGGKPLASALTFPILFLIFMFPLPLTWTNFASVWLQDWVSWMSGRVLESLLVCHQQGNTIHIAGAAEPIYVAQECSGLRQLVSFVALATLVGYLSNRGIIFGLLMVAAAVPVAILSNVLRVLVMALVIRYWGAQSVSGWLHNVPALATLPFGLLMFFVLHWGLSSFFRAPKAEGQP